MIGVCGAQPIQSMDKSRHFLYIRFRNIWLGIAKELEYVISCSGISDYRLKFLSVDRKENRQKIRLLWNQLWVERRRPFVTLVQSIRNYMGFSR